MFEHVVVIVDGSQTSRYAVEASITVAREVHGDITFCLTVDPDLCGEGSGVAGLAEMAYLRCEEWLDDALIRAKAAGVMQATGRILREDPVHAVVQTARAQQSDLLMMGLAPRIGILRPFMRSMAEEILRETEIPLCVVRRPARGWLSRRLLVPVVHDELAAVVIEYALAFARQFNAVLIFCTTEKAGAELRAAAEQAKRAADACGIEAEDLILEFANGMPNAIARLADISACDAIMMASRNRSGWPRLIEGSVSAAVTYESDVPVILVRKPAENGASA